MILVRDYEFAYITANDNANCRERMAQRFNGRTMD